MTHYLALPYDIYIVGAEFILWCIMFLLTSWSWDKLITYLQQNYAQFYENNFRIPFLYAVLETGTGYLQSPDGTKWIPHGEDSGHWRHWDRQNPGGGDEGSWPSNSRKPWPGQGKCKPKQSTSDPNGNAPEMPWPPVMLFMPIEPIPWPGFAPEPIPIFE